MILLLISLVLMLWLLCYSQKWNYINPAVMFCASFVFSAIWATAYADLFDLHLHVITYMVIVGGVLLFALSSHITNLLYKMVHGKKRPYTFAPIEIKRWKLLLLIGIETISCVSTISFLMKSGLGDTLSSAIHGFRRLRLFSESGEMISFPRWLRYIRFISIACGYWFPFILANNFLSVKKKFTLNNVLLIVLLVLSIISSCLQGGRQQFVNVILAFSGSYLLLKKKQSGGGKHVSIKTLFGLVVGMAGVLWLFKNASGLIGKELDTYSLLDYLAKYCGAEIKNLDTYLQYDRISNKSSIWGFQTFREIYMLLGINLPARDLPFRRVNGFELGNVSTTFYDYIYDFGYFGMIVCIIIMAIFVTYTYAKVDSIRYPKEHLWWCAMFSFQVPNILLSFFSNEFYIYTFSKGMLVYCVVWWMLYLLCFKVDISGRHARFLK